MKSRVPSSGSTIHTRSARSQAPSSGSSSESMPSPGKWRAMAETMRSLASRSARVTGPSSPGLYSTPMPEPR